jgi:hypothetical protein
MTARDEQEPSAGSILRELIFNQYQAIVLGGAAALSLIALNPLPLLVWLGSELVLLPVLDSGPLRRLAARRRLAQARAAGAAERARLRASLTPAHVKRFAAMEQLCGLIESNYQSLTGISQAYLADQRRKLDAILQSGLHRLIALQRYERLPANRSVEAIDREIAALEREVQDDDPSERAAAALRKNIELKRRLRDSVAQVDDTMRALVTELDSMEALLEVLHQNSISLRDPQAISEELDTIVRQSEDSERVVRELESLLRAGTEWAGDLAPAAGARPPASAREAAGDRPPRRIRTP